MQGSSHKSLSRDAKLAEAETKKNSQCLGDVLTSANPVLDDTSDPSSYLQAPASIRRSHLNTDDDSRLASTLELTDSNRVYTSIDDSVTYPSRRLQEHPRLQPEATFAHTMDADSHGSPSSLDPLHRNCAASTDVLVVGQTAAQTKSSGSVMKPRGLTLSAFRRPENTIRLTQADPLRRLELEYDLHGACARGVLGHGAFSTVRLAVRLSDGVQVAVKSIAKHEALRSRRLRHVQGVTLRGHYLEEWEILRRLQNHPYVINLLDVFETLEEIQLVTEYCPGGELFDAIQKKQRKNRRSGSSSSSSEAQAAQITSQILLALNGECRKKYGSQMKRST